MEQKSKKCNNCIWKEDCLQIFRNNKNCLDYYPNDICELDYIEALEYKEELDERQKLYISNIKDVEKLNIY